MKDFTTGMYVQLLDALKAGGYQFQRFSNFLEDPKDRVIILRHDVDLRNWAALRLAHLEHQWGIHSTYYFRMGRQSFDPNIIQTIANMGHEIGYHYEDLTSANGDYSIAIKSFQKNLAKLRQFYPVETICMHGRSGSPYDNRDLWKRYDYKDFDVIGEPYLSVDYNRVLYLSDTGRRWNGNKVSVRDKVDSKYDFNFRTTKDIMENISTLPNQTLITAHPEQWTDNILEWLYVKQFATVHTIYKLGFRNKLSKRRRTRIAPQD